MKRFLSRPRVISNLFRAYGRVGTIVGTLRTGESPLAFLIKGRVGVGGLSTWSWSTPCLSVSEPEAVLHILRAYVGCLGCLWVHSGRSVRNPRALLGCPGYQTGKV